MPLEPRALSIAITAGVVYFLGVLIDFLWLALGKVIQPLFDAPRSGRVMRIVFAILMVLAVLYAFA